MNIRKLARPMVMENTIPTTQSTTPATIMDARPTAKKVRSVPIIPIVSYRVVYRKFDPTLN